MSKYQKYVTSSFNVIFQSEVLKHRKYVTSGLKIIFPSGSDFIPEIRHLCSESATFSAGGDFIPEIRHFDFESLIFSPGSDFIPEIRHFRATTVICKPDVMNYRYNVAFSRKTKFMNRKWCVLGQNTIFVDRKWRIAGRKILVPLVQYSIRYRPASTGVTARSCLYLSDPEALRTVQRCCIGAPVRASTERVTEGRRTGTRSEVWRSNGTGVWPINY